MESQTVSLRRLEENYSMSLRDSYSASGNQYRDNDISELAKIGMTKGSVNKVNKDLQNFKEEANARLEVTDNSIIAEVKRATEAEGELSAKIKVTAEEITSRVEDTEGKFSELEQTIDGWTFKTASGETKISGSMIETGLLKGVTILFTKQDSLFWACGVDEIQGSDRIAEWACDSNALYCHNNGKRTIHLWRESGDAHFTGNCYVSGTLEVDEIKVTGSQSYWQGWNLSDTLQDIENRLKALEG